jgi:hypothetical protein
MKPSSVGHTVMSRARPHARAPRGAPALLGIRAHWPHPEASRPPEVTCPEAERALRRLEVSSRPVPRRHSRSTGATRTARRVCCLPRSAPPLAHWDFTQERPTAYKKPEPVLARAEPAPCSRGLPPVHHGRCRGTLSCALLHGRPTTAHLL